MVHYFFLRHFSHIKHTNDCYRVRRRDTRFLILGEALKARPLPANGFRNFLRLFIFRQLYTPGKNFNAFGSSIVKTEILFFELAGEFTLHRSEHFFFSPIVSDYNLRRSEKRLASVRICRFFNGKSLKSNRVDPKNTR